MSIGTSSVRASRSFSSSASPPLGAPARPRLLAAVAWTASSSAVSELRASKPSSTASRAMRVDSLSAEGRGSRFRRSYSARQSAATLLPRTLGAPGGDGGRDGGSFSVNLLAGGVAGGVVRDCDTARLPSFVFVEESVGEAGGVGGGFGRLERATRPRQMSEMRREANEVSATVEVT